MKRIVFVVVGVLGTAVACSSSTSTSSRTSSGIIAGVLEMEGVAAPGSSQPVPGTVTIKGQNGQTVKTEVVVDGSFSASVPAGRYTVTARSPKYENGEWDCVLTPPSTIAVTTGGTTKVTVDCVTK